MAADAPESIVDRRLRRRLSVVGTAVVLTSERYVGTFLVENISADGALLAGDMLLTVGEEVRVLLQIQGLPRFGVRGVITRCAKREAQTVCALHFQASPSLQDLLQEAALRAIETSGPLTLVVEDDAEACASFALELEGSGRSTVGVQTALDAIGWLHAPGACVEAVAVGRTFADMDGLDLLEFIALDFPTIRRVLVVGGNEPLPRACEAVHAILKRPYTASALGKAFAWEGP
jgi:hypothetical protein